jgi:extracellular elastinolytic metalloproteinase
MSAARRLTGLAALGAALVVTAPAHALTRQQVRAAIAQQRAERHAFLDVRLRGDRVTVSGAAAVRRAQQAFAVRLGAQRIVEIDRLTGTPRWLGRRDGFLSGPAAGSARHVAMRWVRAHLDVLGLSTLDLRGLDLVRDYRSPDGVTHLMWAQTVNGIPAFDNTLRVHVTRDGRILSFQGSPRAGLAREARTRPTLTAGEALAVAAQTAPGRAPSLAPRVLRAAGARRLTSFAGGHTAKLILFNLGDRVALAWRVHYEASSTAIYDTIVDAQTGALLWRTNRVLWANGLAWGYYPGAPKGGDAQPRDFGPWLAAGDRLQGNNAHVYLDFDSTDLPEPVEEVPPSSGNDWNYAYTPFSSPLGFCPPAGCTWNHLVNGSWIPNRNQAATQVFYFVNLYHDHLAASPISFTEAAGNFQTANSTGQGKGGDAVLTEPMDSAAVLAGRPIPLLFDDNANFATPPDGQAPRMQMYLFEPIQVPGVIDAPFSDIHGGDEADVVYHEYTHGVSNRLITDADGEGAVNKNQSGAMGEAWGDWYATDFLIQQGYLTDTEAPGETKVGTFTDSGKNLIRTEPIDCTVGAPAAQCPRNGAATSLEGTGGYTYKDFGQIIGSPEVHTDGEIWAQTLMDLRRRLVAELGEETGRQHVESLVTRGMDLAPAEPSYINMRDAILQADRVAGGSDLKAIWEVFAHRGMGLKAKADDGDDPAPTADFTVPAGLPDRPRSSLPDSKAPRVTSLKATRLRGGRALVTGKATDDVLLSKVTVNGKKVRVAKGRFRVVVKARGGRVVVKAYDASGKVTTVARRAKRATKARR